MRVAAANAATVIARQIGPGGNVLVYTGPGNNGGDGWAVARSLATAGIRVTVREVVAPGSDDAMYERHSFRSAFPSGGSSPVRPDAVVDALLGTGARGEPRGEIAAAISQLNRAGSAGTRIIALDVPSGLDATTGAGAQTVRADVTISFGSVKRGTLVNRGACGEIVVVDIGLGPIPPELPLLVGAEWVAGKLPRIPADAHKGTRGKVAVVAGGPGMGGAAILAADAALRSGAGLVKVVTAESNIAAVHARLPEALTHVLTHVLDDAVAAVNGWGDALLIGPGLGRGPHVREMVQAMLETWRGPTVLDADALNAFDGDLDRLARLLANRTAVITPHPAEMARLVGVQTDSVLEQRFDIGIDVARRLGATVLLKGTPTVVTDAGGDRLVVAAGTPVLATGGSGDALGGIIATLLAQHCGPSAAAAGAWIHGRAAELTPGIRGFTLTDVLGNLAGAWDIVGDECCAYPVVARLPSVGARA